MLSHPLTLSSQSEDRGRDKHDMAPPSELPFTGGPAPPLPQLPLAKDLNPELPLVEDSSPEHPLVEDSSPELPLVEDSSPELPLVEDSSPELPLAKDLNPELPLVEDSSPELPLVEDSSPELPLVEDSSPELPLVEDSSPELPLVEDSSPELPLAEAATQTAPLTPQMSPPRSPPPPPSSPPASFPQMPPGPCVFCSSALPRLLSSLLSLHQKEVRRLIGGAMATINQRLNALERRLDKDRGGKDRGDRDRGDRDRGDRDRGDRDRGGEACPSEGEEPVAGPSQSGKRRRRREEKETRRKRRKHGHRDENDRVDQSERSGRAEDQSEKSVCAVAGQNGLRTPLLLRSQFSSVSHDALGLSSVSHDALGLSSVSHDALGLSSVSHDALGLSSVSHDALGLSSVSHDALGLSVGPWRFSDSAPRSSSRCRSNLRAALMSWMMMPSRPGHAPVRLPWRLSVVAVETAVRLFTAEVSVAPERPLQDRTAPPSVSVDHSYVRLSAPSLVISARRQQRLRANHSTRRRPLPLPPVPTNGLTASLSTAQSAASSNKTDVKRVSQIRIRRASPKETNLTPMGLPKVKRLRKKEFSLEEIYTNKNYKSPSANSSLETIFEEPREKDGALLLIGQQRRRRVLQFPDFTQPRKRKRAPTGMGLVAMAPRKRAAARRGCHGDDDCDSDVMLLQRLSALHDFLQRQGLDQDS